MVMTIKCYPTKLLKSIGIMSPLNFGSHKLRYRYLCDGTSEDFIEFWCEHRLQTNSIVSGISFQQKERN
jgi:hypothetical protein